LLDALPAERAYELTYRKWEDALLGLAGAYAVYALPADERTDPFLQTVLGNLTVLAYRPHGRPVPDIDLLGAALTARRGGALSPGERSTLESWGRSGAVPVLRWGVPLAIRLVDDGVLPVTSFGRWREELCRIEEAMSSISVWTAWRAQPGK
jgi:hypothetical protein